MEAHSNSAFIFLHYILYVVPSEENDYPLVELRAVITTYSERPNTKKTDTYRQPSEWLTVTAGGRQVTYAGSEYGLELRYGASLDELGVQYLVRVGLTYPGSGYSATATLRLGQAFQTAVELSLDGWVAPFDVRSLCVRHDTGCCSGDGDVQGAS